MEYTDITRQHIASLGLPARKVLGQYMTPASIGDRMAALLGIPEGSAPDILDPASGTGELLLAARRACPQARLIGFDVDGGMVAATSRNIADAECRVLSIFDEQSREHYGRYDYIIGNPPYFEMKKDDPRLAMGGVEGFASLEDKGRLNIYALFVEYALRLVKPGGRVSYLIPPSMNNGAFFKCLRRRILELSRIVALEMVRENDSFEDAMTSVQILVLERNGDGYEANLAASGQFVHDTGSTVIYTDSKSAIEKFASGRASIVSQGFSVKTGTVVWNKHKSDFRDGVESEDGVARAGGGFEAAPQAGMAPVVFAKDISTANKLELSGRISAPGHWLPAGSAKYAGNPAIVVNRIVGSLDNPHLRFALVELDRFFGENHVNVITRDDGDARKIRELYSALSRLDSSELSGYLQAVTGNTQLSATELGEMPVDIID